MRNSGDGWFFSEPFTSDDDGVKGSISENISYLPNTGIDDGETTELVLGSQSAPCVQQSDDSSTLLSETQEAPELMGVEEDAESAGSTSPGELQQADHESSEMQLLLDKLRKAAPEGHSPDGAVIEKSYQRKRRPKKEESPAPQTDQSVHSDIASEEPISAETYSCPKINSRCEDSIQSCFEILHGDVVPSIVSHRTHRERFVGWDADSDSCSVSFQLNSRMIGDGVSFLTAHRECFVGWDADGHRAGVKGRLVEVLHGYVDNNLRQPRTLVVFEWCLVPGAYGERLKSVQILAAFQGEQIEYDPVPVVWAPDAPIHSYLSRSFVSNTKGGELGAQLGYTPIAGVTATGDNSTTRAVERIDTRRVFGTAVTYKPKGTPQSADRDVNAVLWRLNENKTLHSGLQYHVRTAVLLKRRPEHVKPFALTVQAEANVTRMRKMMKTVLRMIKLSQDKTEGRTAFDPTVEPGTGADGVYDDNVAARPTTRDWRNLQTVDLNEILIEDNELSEALSTGGGGNKSANGHGADSDTLVSDTNTTQQMPSLGLPLSEGS